MEIKELRHKNGVASNNVKYKAPIGKVVQNKIVGNCHAQSEIQLTWQAALCPNKTNPLSISDF
jgi:hypothetical protein